MSTSCDAVGDDDDGGSITILVLAVTCSTFSVDCTTSLSTTFAKKGTVDGLCCGTMVNASQAAAMERIRIVLAFFIVMLFCFLLYWLLYELKPGNKFVSSLSCGKEENRRKVLTIQSRTW